MQQNWNTRLLWAENRENVCVYAAAPAAANQLTETMPFGVFFLPTPVK